MIARRLRAGALALGIVAVGFAAPAFADQVNAVDTIVQGSTCVGFDCVNGLAFGTDTLRLAENNTRFAFDDQSAVAAAGGADWELTANETSSGGLNHLQLLNRTSGAIGLRVLGAAPTDALIAADSGAVQVGAGTAQQRVDGTSTSAPAAFGSTTALARLSTLPIGTWRHAADPAGTLHIGPDGAAFNTAFGVGSGSEVAISDLAGAALQSVRELDAVVQAAGPGATGDTGARGAEGARGPAGTNGVDGRNGRNGVTNTTADAELRRRLARLTAQGTNLRVRTSLLELRAGTVRRGIANLDRY